MLRKNRRQTFLLQTNTCPRLARGSCSRLLATCTQVVIARRAECTAQQSPYHTLLVIANPQQDFFAKPKCEPATSHTCGVVEAISSQATLVFGLLRYARNDKKIRRPRGSRTLAMTTCC